MRAKAQHAVQFCPGGMRHSLRLPVPELRQHRMHAVCPNTTAATQPADATTTDAAADPMRNVHGRTKGVVLEDQHVCRSRQFVLARQLRVWRCI